LQLRLGREAAIDPAIQRVFVLFDFLPQFVPVTDQRTHSVPKTGAVLDIAFTRGTPLDTGYSSLRISAEVAIGIVVVCHYHEVDRSFCHVGSSIQQLIVLNLVE
jgi:hypothetical protein